MIIRNKQIPVRHLLNIVIGWMHSVLIAAPLYTLLRNFIVGEMTRAEVIHHHLLGLALLIPVVISWFARRYLKNILLYLLASIVAFVLTVWIFDHIVMVVPAVLVCFLRFYNRLIEEESSLLDAPVYPGLILFLIPVAAAFFVEHLDNIYQMLGFLYMAVYFLLCFVHHGIERIDTYIQVNQNMRNMPARRILRISCVLLASVFFLLAAVLLPTLLTTEMNFRYVPPPQQEYTVEYESPETIQGEVNSENADLLEPFRDMKPNPVLRFIVKLTEYLLFIGFGLGIVVGAVYGAIKLSRMFTQSFQDRGDFVENLQDDQLEVIQEKRKKSDKPGFFDRSPNAVIRRRYKKTILRAAKNRPEKWMSPAEAEAHAKLTGSAIDNLHALYEKARYSPDGCTKQDVSQL